MDEEEDRVSWLKTEDKRGQERLTGVEDSQEEEQRSASTNQGQQHSQSEGQGSDQANQQQPLKRGQRVSCTLS